MLSGSDFDSIARILSDHTEWGGTATDRRRFVGVGLLDYSRRTDLLSQLKLEGTPQETAEEVLLALLKAGQDARGVTPLPHFLKYLSGKFTDEPRKRLLLKFATQARLVWLLRDVDPALIGKVYRQSVREAPVDRYPDTPEEQIGYLLELGSGDRSVVPLLVFITQLAEVEPELAGSLWALAEPYARNSLGASDAQVIASRNSQFAPPNRVGSHAIAVVVRLQGNDPGQDPRTMPLLVQMYHWVPGRSETPDEYPETGAAELDGVQELASWIREWIPYALEVGGTDSPDVLVEFFLPTPLLGLPVDTWEIDSDETTVTLGFSYPVVVRAESRYRSDHKIALMRERSRLVAPEIHWLNPPYPGERYDYALAQMPQKGCVALSYSACCHEGKLWVHAIQAGIPWGIWVRRDIDGSPEAVQHELSTIVGAAKLQDPARLPHLVQQARGQSAPGVDVTLAPIARRVRENLSLLYEDPDRYPPFPRERRSPKVR